jgi:hypothetical protein
MSYVKTVFENISWRSALLHRRQSAERANWVLLLPVSRLTELTLTNLRVSEWECPKPNFG